MTTDSARVLVLIACLSALPLTVGLTGCANDRYNQGRRHQVDDDPTAGHAYNQTTDQRIEDSRTAERVREALAAGADYRYDGVEVTAFKGRVQLSGVVKTRAQKNAAGNVASKAAGVKEVVNDIAVKD